MIVAIDTGGTKTLIALFSTDGTVLDQVRFPTPATAVAYLSELREQLQRITAGKTVEVVSFACPGTNNGDILTWAGGNLGWENVEVGALLRSLFPDTPVLLGNDANLGGLGEVRLHDAPPRLALYLTVSTGIGSGIIFNGHIDPTFANSEVGHAVFEHNGTRATWESFASGKAIYNTYGMFAKDITDTVIWSEIANRISTGLLVLIPTLQPDVIIFGGSIGTHFAQYGDALRAELAQSLPSVIAVPELIQATHPEEAVIYGCYFNALDTLTR